MVYRAAFGPPVFMHVVAKTPQRAAEIAAKRLGVPFGQFGVYQRLRRGSQVHEGEVWVENGRATNG